MKHDRLGYITNTGGYASQRCNTWCRTRRGQLRVHSAGQTVHGAEEVGVTDTYTGEDMLDKLIARIVQLDHADEQGKPDEKQYCRERAQLRDEARAKLGSSQ